MSDSPRSGKWSVLYDSRGGLSMRFGWLALGILSVVAAKPAAAQVSVYGDLSAVKLTNLTGSKTVFGPVIGLTAELGGLSRLRLSGDLRASFYGTGVKLDGLAIGPKVSLVVKRATPYTELLVGFARYNDGTGTKASGTTDGQLQVNTGLDLRTSNRVDWRVFEFGYEQYYALGGQFNPKTFSTGFVIHLGKR